MVEMLGCARDATIVSASKLEDPAKSDVQTESVASANHHSSRTPPIHSDFSV